MANVQINTTQAWACFCDADLSAGLVPGPETVEYNDSIYNYEEGATPADAVQAMVDSGRTPTDESFDRMESQVVSAAGTNAESQETLDQLADLRKVQDGTFKEPKLPPQDDPPA